MCPPPGVGAEGTPVNVGLAKGAFAAKLFVTVVEKLASSLRAAASSFKVSNAPGAESTKPVICVSTSDSAPSSPSDGDLWYNTSVGGLFVYYQDADSSQWVEIVGKTGATGPAGAGAGSFVEKTSSYTAVAGDKLIVDTSNAVTITLPTSATIGDEIRVIDGTAKNAVSTTGQTASITPPAEVVKNEASFNSQLSALDSEHTFVAKYPGALGNSLQVSICPHSANDSAFNQWAYKNEFDAAPGTSDFATNMISIALCITRISVQEIWLHTNILELVDCFPTTSSFNPNNLRIKIDHIFLIKKWVYIILIV